MKKSAVITSIDYSVPLSENQFNYLEKRNKKHFFNDEPFDLNSILTTLTNSYDIEFNGHFGTNVFFSLSYEHKEEAEIIAKIIKMYANKRTFQEIFYQSLHSPYNHKKNTGFVSPFEYQLQLFKS